jgi:Rrf2 family protein
MLSQSAEYALRAMVHLAEQDGEETRMQSDEIADVLGLPRNYLSKILHELVRSGLLKSTRGPKGGFTLAEPPDQITLERIVGVFDPQLLADERRCLMGQEICSDDEPCPAHNRWKAVSLGVRVFFSETTLAELAADKVG